MGKGFVLMTLMIFALLLVSITDDLHNTAGQFYQFLLILWLSKLMLANSYTSCTISILKTKVPQVYRGLFLICSDYNYELQGKISFL